MRASELIISPDRAAFSRICKRGAAIPLRADIHADTETPISAFLKVAAGERRAFLFESTPAGDELGRWSFVGARPRRRFQWSLGDPNDPIAELSREIAAYRAAVLPGMPRFTGGLVGYFSYDAVRLFEPRVPLSKPDELGFPDIVFMDFDAIVAFDHLRRSVSIVAEARCDDESEAGKDALYNDALRRIQRLARRLSRPLAPAEEKPLPAASPPSFVPRVSRAAFVEGVRRARAYIEAGDCQQIVLSQRFDAEDAARAAPPFEVYRALRRINPSPYLYYFKDGERALVGSSPETLARLEGGEITVRPIAGTRRRGKDPAEEGALIAELLADPKENAEHMMLVDLGRNDVGRVAEIGSVRASSLRAVERYSHVMHMASEVRGRLARGKGALDVLRAAFPAGTVSGAPKVRAMEIIDELEPARRGPYAGCVGYFDRSGSMEMAILIRTLFASRGRLSAQAGAGVVFDSDPDAEYEETLNKARALFAAVASAGRTSPASSVRARARGGR